MNQTIAIFSLLFVFTEICWAFPESYSPFENSEIIAKYPVYTCIMINREGSTGNYNHIYSKKPESTLLINLSVSEKDGFSIKITEQSDNVLLLERSIDGNPIAGFDVYWSDLNEDGKDDYIIQTWEGGSGLAALLGYFTFIVSSVNSYHVIPITTMAPSIDDFVDLNNNNKCQFVHTIFIEGETGKDGKRHNYWVNNLFEFRGKDIVLANNVDKRFPKWIMYTYKPNHKATNQLSDKQKERLLREELRPFYDNIKEKITSGFTTTP